jgi:hypothetical protein
MAIDIEKLTVPLGIVASVIAVYAFLRPGTTTQVTGALPQPLTVPTFAAQPIITSNVATPTPQATASSPMPTPAAATGTYSASAPYLPYNPPGGVVINFGAGAPTVALTQSTTGTNSTPSNSCCDPCGANRPKPVLSYARQISQSAVL